MEKSTVYLSAAQKAALTRTAQAEGRSEATLIRAGIDIVTTRHRVGEAAVPFELPAEAGAGARAAAPRRPRWVSREAFVLGIAGRQADPGLETELRGLAPDTTDDEPLE